MTTPLDSAIAEGAVDRGVQRLVMAQSSVTFDDLWRYSQRTRNDNSAGDDALFPTTASAALSIDGQTSIKVQSARQGCPYKITVFVFVPLKIGTLRSHFPPPLPPLSELAALICGSAAVAAAFCIGGYCLARRRALLLATDTPTARFRSGCYTFCVGTPRRELLLAEAASAEETISDHGHSSKLRRGLPPLRAAVTAKAGMGESGRVGRRYAGAAENALGWSQRNKRWWSRKHLHLTKKPSAAAALA
jgi:hypothetical protein